MSDSDSNDETISDVVQFAVSCCRFSFGEVRSATNNFDEKWVIGVGGFGKVYKGFIRGGATLVAVKRLIAESSQGEEEFWTEVKMLSKVRHPHLVALIGYCSDFKEMILVYEYMAKGTLADHLYTRGRKEGAISITPLTWEQRLDICIGAARGLDHLHSGTKQSFIHRDVKTTNILLNKKWVAKISDFGLSKGTTSQLTTHVTTNVKGTFGYLDPDYFLTHRLTKKSDVYAFGVVLLEVLCGRRPVDERLGEDQISLVFWAKDCMKKGNFDQIIDPSLNGQISPQCLNSFANIADNCLQESPKSRPTMAQVVGSMVLALGSQQKRRSKGILTRMFRGISPVPKWMPCSHSYSERKHNSSRSEPCRRFSLLEIRAATNDFDNKLLIGHGVSGKVYKGCIDGGTLMVAIKRLEEEVTLKDLNTFMSRVQRKPLLYHSRPIVYLIGYCNEKHEFILVYDYMLNGSLRDHLHGETYDPLLWKKRLSICIDAARGLQCLHVGATQRVIHRKIRSSNILLDEIMTGKIMDLTWSKKYVTQETEVYHFGCVLLEVLCHQESWFGHFSAIHWFKESILSGTNDVVIDPYLIGKIAPKCFKEYVTIALLCLHSKAIQRPSMDDVDRSLRFALSIQEAWENLIEIGAESRPSTYNNIVFLNMTDPIISGSLFLHVSHDL